MKKFSYIILFVLLINGRQITFAQLTQYIKLINKTGITITKVFIAPVTESERWSNNLLLNENLESEDTVTINFNKSNYPEDCIWDLKVINNRDNSLYWYDLDLCRFNVITLFWDEKKDKCWAEYELYE